MKYSFLNKRITFGILLFYFITIQSQKLTVINKTGDPLSVNDGGQETKINASHKKDFSEIIAVSISNSNHLKRSIELFLEPTEKLTVTVEKDDKVTYSGDKASLHEYLNDQLNVDTFGKINVYEQIGEKKNIGELKNVSELHLVEVLKKVKLSNLLLSPEDKVSIKKLKTHIKYNWLYTVFFTFSRRDKAFRTEAINYYYKKYIETDIARYNCNNAFQYSAIETLAKNQELLKTKLPLYPIVEHTEDDNVNQYLPQSCQKQYFRQKYNYLEHINGHNKEYYKKILAEKFNDQ